MSKGINVGGDFKGDGVFTVGDNNKVRAAPQSGGKTNAQESTTEMKRKKSEKFGILDSPSLLDQDLEAMAKKAPRWGVSVIYLDIDDFKQFNTQSSETAVDRELLPQFQEFIASAVEDTGYAYAEGGDEVIIMLPNHSKGRAEFFAHELLGLVRDTLFSFMGKSVSLTVSMGIASSTHPRDFKNLRAKANQGKKVAKEPDEKNPKGKNRFVSVQ